MTRYEAIEKALQNMMGMFDTPAMRLKIKFDSMVEEACASGRNALELPKEDEYYEPMPYKVMRDGDKVRFDVPDPPKDGE